MKTKIGFDIKQTYSLESQLKTKINTHKNRKTYYGRETNKPEQHLNITYTTDVIIITQLLTPFFEE